jgi:hypothetical protein
MPDFSGNLYITGQESTQYGFQMTTIKYVETPVLIPPDFYGEQPSIPNAYFQNKGQISGTDARPRNDILFYTRSVNNIFMKKDTLAYVFAALPDSGILDTAHRIDLHFNGETNSNVMPVGLEPLKNFENHYVMNVPEGRTHVTGYHRILYPALYNGIDFHVYNNASGVKYYFVVAPGAVPNQITMEFAGQFSASVNTNGDLELAHMYGGLIFNQAVAYQYNTANNAIINLSWIPTYQLNGGQVTFSIGSYDATKPLVIEISRPMPAAGGGGNPPEWSSYYGGTGKEYIRQIFL